MTFSTKPAHASFLPSAVSMVSLLPARNGLLLRLLLEELALEELECGFSREGMMRTILDCWRGVRLSRGHTRAVTPQVSRIDRLGVRGEAGEGEGMRAVSPVTWMKSNSSVLLGVFWLCWEGEGEKTWLVECSRTDSLDF